MDIIESNKLIAEFMDFTYEKDLGWFDSEGILPQIVIDINDGNCFDELLFDKSWNWLMPVVEKIENLHEDCDVWFYIAGCSINYCSILFDNNCDTKLEATYETIVEFIKWYKEHKV